MATGVLLAGGGVTCPKVFPHLTPVYTSSPVRAVSLWTCPELRSSGRAWPMLASPSSFLTVPIFHNLPLQPGTQASEPYVYSPKSTWCLVVTESHGVCLPDTSPPSAPASPARPRRRGEGPSLFGVISVASTAAPCAQCHHPCVSFSVIALAYR